MHIACGMECAWHCHRGPSPPFTVIAMSSPIIAPLMARYRVFLWVHSLSELYPTHVYLSVSQYVCYSAVPLQPGQVSPKSSQKTRASYRVHFVYSISVYSNYDLYSASFTATMHAASCYIGPRYNGTQLYIDRLIRMFGCIVYNSAITAGFRSSNELPHFLENITMTS